MRFRAQVELKDLYVELGGAAARVTELPYLGRHFSNAEVAAQAQAQGGAKGVADAATPGCELYNTN